MRALKPKCQQTTVKARTIDGVTKTIIYSRRQREDDAARVRLQFPFRSERLGRGAPSVSMKWRDAVKAAIMHGPFPPDVTLDVPHWRQPGMPLLCPTDFLAPAPLKRKRVESKTDPAKQAYMRGARRGEAVVRGLPRLSRPCPWQDIQRNLLRLRVSNLCDRFGISQDRVWNLDERAVRMVFAGERGWTQRAESAHVFASRAFVTVTLAANMRCGMWTQSVYEVKTDRVRPHGPLFPRQLVSHSLTHWITQEALLDMIDAIDTDMNAL